MPWVNRFPEGHAQAGDIQVMTHGQQDSFPTQEFLSEDDPEVIAFLNYIQSVEE